MRGRRTARGWVVCGALAVLVGTIMLGCTDGVTPDCSDAATQCSPNIDGSVTPLETSVVSEASLPDRLGDSATDGGEGDAPNDGDGDAGDGG